VGLAFVLGQALAQALGDRQGLANARDLFRIGTIADMAPLTGVNRRWLMDGLPGLKTSALPGLQALQQVAGLDDSPIDAGSVGFQLAPRINAVGRLGDPQLVVDLLTTADQAEALELARACEGYNRQRRELCEAIEAEAVALVEADGDQQSPFLLLAQTHWHHGVIGIVASRLVERFSRPVALLASEGDGRLRASVRAPAGFAADQALKHCHDLLLRYGGHPAAGGFTVLAERVAELHERLNGLAGAWLEQRGRARSSNRKPSYPWNRSIGVSGSSCNGSNRLAVPCQRPCSGAMPVRSSTSGSCGGATCSSPWPRAKAVCGRSPGAGRVPSPCPARWMWPFD
jgi:single-stranded-DNA-specific exonuclease